MKQIKWPVIALASAILAGLALRITGITWGLPLKYAHIDESVVIFYSFRFFSGDLNPRVFFDYPTFFLYIVYAVEYFYYLAGSFFGYFASLEEFAGKYLAGDITGIYTVARMVSALAGTASIYLVYRISRLFYSEKTGILASILLSLNPLHVLHSHYATVDIFALFMTLIAVYFICRYYIDSKRASFLYACFALGLAAATKYYPLVFFANLLLIPLFKKEKITKRLLFLYLCGAGVVISGFILGCPYSVLDFPAFSARFSTIFTNVVKPESLNPFKNALLIVSYIYRNTGIVIFTSGAAVLLFAFRKREDFFLLTFPVVFFIFSLGFKVIGAHYIFPLYPFLFILAASGLENVSNTTRVARFTRDTLFYLASALFIAVSLPSIIQIDRVLTQRDTRLTARDWVLSNVPKKSMILRLPYTPEFKPGDGYTVKVDWDYKIPQSEYKKYGYIINSGADPAPAGNFDLAQSFKGTRLSGFHNPTVNIYRRGK